MSLSERTQQFLNNLNNDYAIEVYSEPADTFNTGDIIAPSNMNRVYLVIQMLAAVIGQPIGFTSPSSTLLPIPSGIGGGNTYNINFDSIFPMQEIRCLTGPLNNLVCWGIIRRTLGGDSVVYRGRSDRPQDGSD